MSVKSRKAADRLIINLENQIKINDKYKIYVVKPQELEDICLRIYWK